MKLNVKQTCSLLGITRQALLCEPEYWASLGLIAERTPHGRHRRYLLEAVQKLANDILACEALRKPPNHDKPI